MPDTIIPTETSPLLASSFPAKHVAAISMIVCSYNTLNIDSLLMCLRQEETILYWQESLIAPCALLGAFVGGAFFGVCGDNCGRYKTFLWSSSVMFLGTLCSVFSQSVTQLIAFRFLLGFGVGGQWPMIATIVAESAPPGHGLFALASTITLQAVAFILSSLVPLILLHLGASYDIVWRGLLFVGFLPAPFILGAWWRLEPASVNNALACGQREYSLWKVLCTHKVALTGTVSTWFLNGIVYYGLAAYRSQIAGEFIGSGVLTRDEAIYVTSFALLYAAATLPGFVVMITWTDKVGARPLQSIGFACIALTCVAILEFNQYKIFVASLLSLTFFFACMGPNSTTFIIPALHFPVSERATCHGISSSSGKLGAVFGSAVFPLLNYTYGTAGIFTAVVFVCCLGVVLTVVFCPNPGACSKDILGLDSKDTGE